MKHLYMSLGLIKSERKVVIIGFNPNKYLALSSAKKRIAADAYEVFDILQQSSDLLGLSVENWLVSNDIPRERAKETVASIGETLCKIERKVRDDE